MRKKIIKVILVFLLLVALGLGVSVLFRARGEWICEEGEWVRLGRPRQSKPSWSCPQSTEIKEKNMPEKESFQKSAGTPLGLENFEVGTESGNPWLLPAEFQEGTASSL